ncbi:MAG: hypothetical protein IPI67_01115 [Myxococcales bacterium]|nr:hypothetical protein [Myxococcales bacterium]
MVQAGGRMNLELEPTTNAVARYRAELSSGAETWIGAVEVSAAGEVQFEAWTPAEPPTWLRDATRAMVRTEWRNRTGESPTHWPRRITRWRAKPANA